MRLISLNIDNFRVIKNLKLSFPDKIIGIIGPNGSGKSSIIEAIAWVLYGNQAARSGKDEIKSSFVTDGSPTRVELVFTINEEKYRVVRTISGKSNKADVHLYRGNSSESVGVSETKGYIGELLGLDWKGFLSSFLARQQELNALSDLQPSKRKDHLAGMLGIEKLDTAINLVKQDVKLISKETEFIEQQLLNLPELEKNIELLTAKIAKINSSEFVLKTTYEKNKTDMVKQTNSYKEIQEKKNNWIKLSSTNDSLIRTRNNIIESLETNQKEHKYLTKISKEALELTQQTTGFEKFKLELEKLNEAKTKTDIKKQLKINVSNQIKKINDLKIKSGQIAKKESDKKQQLNSFPENLETLNKNITEKLEIARENYSELKAKHKSALTEMEKLNKQIVSIKELGKDSVCDRCLRPLGNDIKQIREHLETEKRELSEKEKNQLGKLNENIEQGKVLKKESDDLVNKIKLKTEYEFDLKNITAEKKLILSNTEADNKKLYELEKELKQYHEIDYDDKLYKSLIEKVDKIQKIKDKLNLIEGQLKRIPGLESEIKKQKLQENDISKELNIVELEIKKIDYEEKELQSIKALLETTQSKFDKSRSEYETAKNENKVFTKELEGKLEQRNNLMRSQEQLDEKRSTHFHLEKLTSLFSEYRSFLISNIRPTLANLSGTLISDMTNGKYNMIELDDKYNLQILDYGSYFGVERFSGGEKDLANLCLRMAISLSLTEAAGMSSSFIILDEVFGSQDGERRDLIIKALSNLKNRFPQIILVTHLEDIKDKVEMLIQVEPTSSGWSEIKVSGETE